jgi:Zn finger protein HypA/HybF involved in hydrogenase expression
MATVRCPDCGQDMPLPPGTRSRDLLPCPNCAGLSLRVREDGGRWVASIGHTVSCPDCDRKIVLPETAKAGDLVKCGGRRYRLTFEYGTFAAEPT